MKSLTGKFTSVGGWAPLLALLLGAGLMISACGDEEVPTPTTPAPTPAPTPTPTPTPTPPPDPEPTGPATPSNLRVSAATSNSITWTWDAVEGVLGYQGQFSTDTTFTDSDRTFIIVAPQTSHTIQNLPGNMTGHFRVRSGTGTSLTDLTFSEWSEGTPGTTRAPPAAVALSAPGNFRATDETDNSITLEWNKVDDADHYEVEQQVDGASGWGNASCGGEDEDNEVDDEECVASGLDLGTDYNFRVRAIPASGDTANSEGDWTERSSVSTTGTRPPETGSMGEGDLNVTWESSSVDGNSHSITWEWDLVEERDHKYQYNLIDDITKIDSSNPCPKPTVGTWMPADGMLDFRRHPVSNLSAGDVRLLCVQTTWMDDNDVRQYGNRSWSWAATTPLDPGTGTATDSDMLRRTTSLAWPDLELDPGFSYPVRLVSASQKDGGLDAASTAKMCADGTSIGTETSGLPNLGLGEYTIPDSSVREYMSYALCYRAENDSGQSGWAVGTIVNTLPGSPPTPSRDSSRTTRTQLVWNVGVANDSDVPYQNNNTAVYDAVIVTPEALVTAAKTRVDAEVCDASNTQATITDTQNGFRATYTSGGDLNEGPEATGSSKTFYLCVRGKLAANREGPWAIGSASVSYRSTAN